MTNLLYLSYLHSGCNTYLMHKPGWRKFQRRVSAAALCTGRAVLTCRTSWAPPTACAMSERWLWPHISLWDCILPSARILPAKPVHPSGAWNIAGVLALLFRWLGYPLVDVLWVIQQKCSSSTSYCVYCTSQLGKREQEFVSLSYYTTVQLACRKSKEKHIVHCLINSCSPGQEKTYFKKYQDIFMGQKENWALKGLPTLHCCWKRRDTNTHASTHQLVSGCNCESCWPQGWIPYTFKAGTRSGTLSMSCDGLRSFPQTC